MVSPRRRLSDKLEDAFHQACDQQDFEAADMVLKTLEHVLTRKAGELGSDKRIDTKSFEDCYLRFDKLKPLMRTG